MAMHGANSVAPSAGEDIEMIYVTYGIGLAAILAGVVQVWAGLQYFLAHLRAGNATSGMQMLELALIKASARVFIGVQFFIIARYRGLGPDGLLILWPIFAAIISLVVARVYAHLLKRNRAVPLQDEHSRS